ncbi:protein OXIDATIVE STRESS 3-like [Andrographis paniculata]|uniref:protein OXIDATIVE STRESS 3-like n=1 Tax=Andrographis paniculata TaxID=175694 RepID=UPI0021E74AAF|nr:protein OXIDATIVE STRESS 3-like [Andrographis paniculata]
MGEEKQQDLKGKGKGKGMEEFVIKVCESSMESSLSSSSSSPEVDDDDGSSSSSSYCRRTSCGPLYELSQLTDHLPIKRGLSKFYNGKSQSFASMADVESCAKDLAKKGNCYNRKMKWSKSYGGNLNQQIRLGPKPFIAKRSPRRSFSTSLAVDSF